MAGFDVYEDEAGEWRWRFKASNGRIMADSGEGYTKRGDCEAAIATIKKEIPTAPVT